MYFGNYRLPKTWLENSLKTAVSEYPSTVNILKAPKHFRIPPESTFVNFFITPW